MRKGKTVIGQDVFSLGDGRRVHSVKDLLVSEDHGAIIALLVDEGGLLGTSTIVPIEAVHRFGPDAVMIQEASSVVPASADERVAAVIDRKDRLLGTAVVTNDGQKVGTIGDIYFDEESGAILGYEVSGGTVGDVMRGTSWLPLESVEVVGPDAVIARPEAKEIVDSQVGGVQAALESAQVQAADAGQQLGDRIGSAVDDLKATTSAGGGEGAQPQDPAANDPDGVLVGRRAAADVTDRTGAVVVANGQRVTLEHVRRARDEDGLDALYAAVGVERPKPVGEQVQEVAQQATETAGDLWNRFTTKLSEMTDAAGRRMDAQQTRAQLDRIHDAIGRPVTKVFLDRDDNVILDLGDLITHQAVQRAYEAGMLDSLLASVYTMDVRFTQDDLKASVPGDSTIEQASGGASLLDELEGKVAEAEAPAPQEADDADRPKDQAGSTSGQGGSSDTETSTDQSGGSASGSSQGRRTRSTRRGMVTDQAGGPAATAGGELATQSGPVGASVGIDEGPIELPARTESEAGPTR